jgi:diguanylate cyclase (GGDEF)-like protein/PAS domain S-box-containing protein
MVANLLAFHLFVTSILFLLVGAYSLHRRQVSTAAIPFSVAMFSLAIFTLLAGWDVLSATLEIKITLMRLRLSILPFTVIAGLVAALENAQRAAWLTRRRIGLLSIIPALNLAFVWLPGLEKYLRSGYKLGESDFLSTLTYSNGVWFWILLGYLSLIALIVFGVQFNVLLNSKGIYFKQTLFLNIGQVIPAVLIILFAAGALDLAGGYNYAPHALMLTALLNGWAIYRYQWRFAAPMARDIALDLVDDMMLVVNESDCISDANTSARKFFEISDDRIGINISELIPSWNKIRADVQAQEILRQEIDLSKDNKIKTYELTVNSARNPSSQMVSSYVLSLREITEQKRQQEQVQNLVRAVSQSPNSVLITSRDGVIEYVNPSFTRLTGYLAEEAIGQKPSLFKSGQTPDSVYKAMWETINSGQIWKGDLLNRRKDGEAYWEETLIAPLFDQYGQVVNYISIKEDISARKEVDEILHRRLEELLMVNTISIAAASQLDLNSLVSLIGQQLEQSFNARSVLVALHNHDSEFIEIPYWTIDKKRVKPPQIKYGEGLVSHILKTRQPLLISSNFKETAPQMGHKPVFADQYGYPKTWLGVPIISGQQTVGVISLQNYTKEFAFNDDDVRLLNTISASISVSIDNARLYRAAQQEIEERIRAEEDASRRTSQLSVLYEIGHSLTKELELEVVLNSLMEKCKQLAPVDVFVVGLYDSENDQVKFIKFNDNGKERAHIHLEKDLDQYITGEVIKKQITIHLPDCSNKTIKKKHHLRHTTKQHALSYLGIPLFRGDEVTGILSVQSYQPNAFSLEQIQTLEIIASQAAIAIDNARLYEVARRRADEMSLLYEISLGLSANLDTDQVLRNLLEKCRQILTMDSFYVSIYEERSHLIYYPLFYDRGEFKNVPVRDIRISPGLTGEVILGAKTIYLPDTNDPKIADHYQIIHVGGTPTRSFVGVPMIVRGKVIGVISMQSYTPTHYSAEQIRLIETIATQAAIAVENSRLYEAARKEIIERREAQENLQQTNQELQVQLQRVESLQEELREQAIRDSLTGLFNRRYLDESFSKKINGMKKTESSLAVIMLDIDHFKSFNDTYGHSAGDELLAMLGELLRNQTRQSDVACRYGGEEFVILLPDTSLEVATKRAEEIRHSFESIRVSFEGKSLKSTISIGISIYPDHGDQPEALIIQADQALYQAKSSGRNRVVAWRR